VRTSRDKLKKSRRNDIGLSRDNRGALSSGFKVDDDNDDCIGSLIQNARFTRH